MANHPAPMSEAADSQRDPDPGRDPDPHAAATVVSIEPRAGAAEGPQSGGEDAARQGEGAARVDTLLRCLARVTMIFERPVTAADIHAATPIGDRGMTPTTFERAARRLGYRTRLVTLDARSIGELPVPFVVAGAGGRQSVLVTARRGGEIILYDPVGDTTARATPETVLAMSDTACLIRPEDRAGTPGWRDLIGQRLRAVLWEIIVASALINLFALASPLFLMTVYNKVLGQRAYDTLYILVIGMLAVYAFDLLLRTLRGYVSSHTGARIDALIGSEVVHHLVRLPYRHFERTPTGLIGERVRQLDTIRAFFTGQMPVTLVDMAFVVIFVAALFFINTTIALITLAAFPVFALISFLFHRQQRELLERNFMAQAAKASALNETINNALTIKALGLESDMESRWGRRLALGAWTGFRAHNMTNIINTIGAILQQLVALAIIFVGVGLILSGKLSLGGLIAANILATRAIAPIRQVVSAWSQAQEVRAAFHRLESIMSEDAEHRFGEQTPVARVRGDVKFEGIVYRFEQDAPNALDSLDLHIAEGTIMGLIGPSGSGKSTLVKVFQGLYTPERGRVLIDGTDLAHFSPAALRSQLGVVPQEVQLFAGSVRENIALGVPVKDPVRVTAVARFVGAHDFIQRLPRGYDTVLGEGGTGLSAGQRQLICIARALIRNPRIIILDEATSALDPATEERFLRTLRRAARGRTIILVSHRPGPLKVCDRLALLVDGRIEKEGRPRDVLAYARRRAAEAQFTDQLAGGPAPTL